MGTTDEGMNTRHFPAHEREELVQKLEASKDQVYCGFNLVLSQQYTLHTDM